MVTKCMEMNTVWVRCLEPANPSLLENFSMTSVGIQFHPCKNAREKNTIVWIDPAFLSQKCCFFYDSFHTWTVFAMQLSNSYPRESSLSLNNPNNILFFYIRLWYYFILHITILGWVSRLIYNFSEIFLLPALCISSCKTYLNFLCFSLPDYCIAIIFEEYNFKSTEIEVNNRLTKQLVNPRLVKNT